MTMLVILGMLWLMGWAVLGRIKRCRFPQPTDLKPPQKISVIIPARNEERNLPRLLLSLQRQLVPPDEIIVVDDASTDNTATIATKHGAAVLSAPALPDGWRGKTWACYNGAAQAKGDWLLFLDADTWLEAEGLSAMRVEFIAVGGGALSVAPMHRVHVFHEQFSIFFNLIMLAGTGAFTILGDRLQPRGLLGQCLLIETPAYQKVGGHAAVKHRILENFWLAEKLSEANIPLHCRGGKNTLTFRMYPNGWRELIDGWIKGFAAGAGQTPLPILLLVIGWLSGLIMAAGQLIAHADLPVSLIAYSLCVLQVGWLMRRVGTFHWATAALFPVPLIFYFIVFTQSIWRIIRKQPVAWKGRSIHGG